MRSILIFVAILSLSFFIGCKMQNGEKQHKRKITQEDLINANRKLVGKDAEEIKDYLRENNLEMTETNTGLWYNIEKEGAGPMAKKGDIAKIAYKIALLDGTLCYSSDSLGLKEFKIGQGGVESGLEEGILLLNKGAKARFILPPHRAHGLVGDDDKIPAHSTIIYDVELVDLK